MTKKRMLKQYATNLNKSDCLIIFKPKISTIPSKDKCSCS